MKTMVVRIPDSGVVQQETTFWSCISVDKVDIRLPRLGLVAIPKMRINFD